MEPPPEIIFQVPFPVEGTPAFMVTADDTQTFWSGPATATEGKESTLIVTVDEDDGQTPLEIVHLKMLLPAGNPFMFVVAEAGLPIVPPPEATVHKPVPTAGTFASSIAVPGSTHIVCGIPATEESGRSSTETVITLLSNVFMQAAAEKTLLR
jgi:hypothetical protein